MYYSIEFATVLKPCNMARILVTAIKIKGYSLYIAWAYTDKDGTYNLDLYLLSKISKLSKYIYNNLILLPLVNTKREIKTEKGLKPSLQW